MSDFDTPPPAPTTVSRSKGLIARVQAILLKPAETWDEIAAEPATIKSIYMGYVLPLAAIGPIAAIIGTTIFSGLFGGLFGLALIIPAIFVAIISYALSLAMVYVLALIIDALAPSFDGQKNMLNAFKVAAYSMTAAWVAAVFQIIPFLGWLGIVGLYSFYLLYLGIPKLMKAPAEKSLGYTIVSIIVSCVLWAVVFWTTTLFVGMGALMGLGAAGIGTHHVASIGGVTSNGDRISGKVAGVDLGKLQQATEQMAAEASAQQNGTTTIKLADPQALLALTPENFMGAARSDVSTSSGGMGSVAASTAKATYVIGDGSVTLTVSDIGTMGGLGAMAAAMNVNTSSSSADGYEKVTTVDGVMTSEKYNSSNKSGEYTIVNNGRISVDAEGNGVDINTIKSLVASVDMGRAKSLAQ